MKRPAAIAALAAAIFCLQPSPGMADGQLKVYHWFEYMPQELVDKFEAETGIDVTIDTYDSNEAMLASLKAGKLGQYDVAVPGDYMVEIMRGEGLLDSYTPDEMANHANIAPQWLDVPFDPGRTHSIPYQWGSTAFSVNRNVYKGDISSLGIIFNPPDELKGKINVLDSQGEVLALASIYLGIPQCTQDREQLKALNDMLLAAKPHWASFSSDTAKDVLVSGDAAAGMIYNGFSAKARAEGANVEYAFPREGYVVWMDNVVLLKDAPNRANAVKFMNFLTEPENAAAVTNYAAYNAGVMGVEPFLSDVVRNSPENNPPKDQKGEFIKACDQETQKLYDAIWTNLKK
jgi:spermidine/putrescine transport system substrate-binding protein